MMLTSNGAGLVEVVIVLAFFAGLWVAAEVLCWMYERGWWRRGGTMHGFRDGYRGRDVPPPPRPRGSGANVPRRPYDWERDTPLGSDAGFDADLYATSAEYRAEWDRLAAEHAARLGLTNWSTPIYPRDDFSL